MVLYLFEDRVNANAFCGICEFDPNPNRVYSAVKSLSFVLFFGVTFCGVDCVLPTQQLNYGQAIKLSQNTNKKVGGLK